jgi:hypothetical protein
MQYLKAACGLVCFLILASNVWSMSHWSESRGVYDDICYLRQAHLFQRFGLDGLDTNIARDDDHYLSDKMKAIDFPDWADPTKYPCHVFMPATKKRAMQYPPGTGFLLALFPAGFQAIPLYVLATVAVFGFGVFAIACATTTLSVLLTATLADLAVYLMINPTKASYSMAPTMAFCALIGFLTARLFMKTPQRHLVFMTISIGFLIGLTVNFRLPNLFLSAGYLLFFLVVFVRSPKFETVLHGGLFGMAFLAGLAPTLIANAINAGSPFTTTYGYIDVVPPDFSVRILWAYVTDLQFVLLVLAGAWAVLILCLNRGDGIRRVALVAAGNLLVNLAFFLSHPIFTPYYTIPVAMLSLWSLLFACLMQPAEGVDHGLSGQAAKA